MSPVSNSKLSSGLRSQQQQQTNGSANNGGASSSAANNSNNNSKQALSSSPSSGNSNKNLSHVPCKFFRQGACQAGNSCPFSHALSEGADQAPCKYFQKGNCKFGSKCALAHILPDGRRVNPPPSRQRNHHNGHHGGNGLNVKKDQLQQQQDQTLSPSIPGSTQPPSTVGAATLPGLGTSPNAHRRTASNQFTGVSPSLSFSSSLQHSSLNQPAATNAHSMGQLDYSTGGASLASRSLYASAALGGGAPGPESLSRASPRSFSQSYAAPDPFSAQPEKTAAQGSLGMALSMSPLPSRSIWNSGSTSGAANGDAAAAVPARSSMTGSRPSYSSSSRPAAASSLLSLMKESTNEFAVVDEDGDDGVFEDEEEFVPSSLNDLLTPQERQRRGSRRMSHGAGSVDIWGNGVVNSHPSSLGPALATAPMSTGRTSFSESTDSPLPHQATGRVLNPIGTPDRGGSKGSLSQRLANGGGMHSGLGSPGFRSASRGASSSATPSNAGEPVPVPDEDTQFYLEQDDSSTKLGLNVIDKVNNLRI